MSNKSIATIATMGIDLGKNSFHVVGLDGRGAIFVNPSDRPSVIVHDDEIVFPPMVTPAHQSSVLVHRSQGQGHGGIL